MIHKNLRLKALSIMVNLQPEKLDCDLIVITCPVANRQ